MSDMLPSNATSQERALSDSISRISDVPIYVTEVWNPDTCPSNVLPWLAWALSVDNWDIDWTDQQKRDSIKQAIPAQRIKGTIGAVEKQLSALGVTIQIQEWFNQIPEGDPYTFKMIITSSQEQVTQIGLSKIMDIVNTNKNLRSHMDLISIIATTLTQPYIASVPSVGNEISVTNYGRPPAVVNDFNLVLNTIRV